MQSPEAYILKSELALRRHAVLMPAEAPSAKRQRTSGSAEPSGACARAHAFVPDSPLSPSKSVRPGSPAVPKHDAEISKEVESPDASGREEASFAVRTDSELEPAQTSPQQLVQDPAEVLSGGAATKDGLHKAHASSRPPDSGGDLQSQSIGPEATSQQQSTAAPDTSAPSTASYETNLVPAAVQGDVNSPISPHTLNDHTTAPAGEAAAAVPALQAATSPTPTAHMEAITVSQLLAAGPYQVDAQQQERVAHNLRVYKAKVDEVHALGRVSRTCRTTWNVNAATDLLSASTDSCSGCTAHSGSCVSNLLLPAAKARYDRLQRAQGAASPKKDAWPHTWGGGGGPLWGQG